MQNIHILQIHKLSSFQEAQKLRKASNIQPSDKLPHAHPKASWSKAK